MDVEAEFAKNLSELETKHDWQGARQLLERYIENSQINSSATFWVKLVRYSRWTQDIPAAQTFALQAIQFFPEEIEIFEEQYRLATMLNQWRKALELATKISVTFPDSSRAFFLLGQANAWLEQPSKALQANLRGLALEHNCEEDQLLDVISNKIFGEKARSLEHNFVPTNGKNNYGGIVSLGSGKKYFTKIVPITGDYRREIIFYQEIQPLNSGFATIAPKFHLHIEDGSIGYLTLEYIEGDQLQISDTEKVIRANSIIKDIDLPEKYREIRNLSPVLHNRPSMAFDFLVLLHDLDNRNHFFASLKKVLDENQYPEEILKIAHYLELHLHTNSVASLAQTETRFSLLHGDLTHMNIITNDAGEVPIIVDWGQFTYGPWLLDLARHFSARLSPFAWVETYLEQNKRQLILNPFEEVLFLASYLIFLILHLGNSRVATRYEDAVEPAFSRLTEKLEKYYELHFLESVGRLDDHYQNLMYKNAREINVKNILQLEQQISDMSVEMKTLRTQAEELNLVMNSTSWRLTKPLRDVVNFLRKKPRN